MTEYTFIAKILKQSPKRKVGKQKIGGYFQSEFKSVDIDKKYLGIMVRQGLVHKHRIVVGAGGHQNFYSLDRLKTPINWLKLFTWPVVVVFSLLVWYFAYTLMPK